MPFPSPGSGDLPDPGIEPTSLALAGGFFTTEPPGKPESYISLSLKREINLACIYIDSVSFGFLPFHHSCSENLPGYQNLQMTKSLREDGLVHWVLSIHGHLISDLTVMATFITENKGGNKRQAGVARVQTSTLSLPPTS